MATRGWENATLADLPGLKPQPKQKSKYRAERTTFDGITFDSKKEAQRYHELKLMQQAGQIRGLRLQPDYPLHVTGTRGDQILIGSYRGDFFYEEDCSGGWVERLEDVKGLKTPMYRWKKKHVEAEYGIDVIER
jgi:hypothetical protein